MGRVVATNANPACRRLIPSHTTAYYAAASALVLAWTFIDGRACAQRVVVDEFPYVAYVVEVDAKVRSGPGRKDYATETLPQGYAVEVYRHDPGGWCAIRPPAESFSLVAMRHVRLIDDKLAEIVAGGAASRIGSAVSDDRSAVQVLFPRGELVELVAAASPGERYVRISPPAGEFRWIGARDLSRTPPIESTPSATNSESHWTAHSASGARRGAVEPAEAHDEVGTGRLVASAEGHASDPLDGGSFSHLLPSRINHSSWASDRTRMHAADEIYIVEGSPAALQLAQHQQPNAAAPTVASLGEAPQIAETQSGLPTSVVGAAPAPVPPVTPTPLDGPPRIRFPGGGSPLPANDNVAQLQLELSQLVVEPPAAWQFAGLRGRTAALLSQTQDELAQRQLQDLLDRIATFERAQVRYTQPWTLARSTPQAPPRTAPPTIIAAPNASQPIAPQPTETTAVSRNALRIRDRVRDDLAASDRNDAGEATRVDPFVGANVGFAQARYDAVGTLRPVVSKREKAPRYALVGDDGQVITFLTPAPELDLERFVGQRIGVQGSRGFMPEYRKSHVAANRVTPLEETVVR